MSGGMPTTWAETLARLAWILGGGPGAAAAAEEWVRQAVHAVYGVGSLHNLTSQQRALALQKTIGTLFALEEIGSDGMLPFQDQPRAAVQDVFARFWGGVVLPGPPWRTSPLETWLPTEDEITSDFDQQEE